MNFLISLLSIFGIFINLSFGDQCEEILVPLCRGLVGYTHTKLPNRHGHTTQVQVYRAIERYWRFIDSGCSENLRLTICGIYLPKCTESGNNTVTIWKPCKETCHRSRRFCWRKFREMQSRYPKKKLKCRGLRRKSSGRCIPPDRPRRASRRRRPANRDSGICQPNMLSMCHNLTFNLGTLPNFFNQSNVARLEIEMSFYQPLIDSDCHPDFRFFLCGTYRPYCIQSNPWILPCRELCEEIKQSCMSQYEDLFGGLPWPQKFQCHRYLYSTTSDRRASCVVPTDGVLALNGA